MVRLSVRFGGLVTKVDTWLNLVKATITGNPGSFVPTKDEFHNLHGSWSFTSVS